MAGRAGAQRARIRSAAQPSPGPPRRRVAGEARARRLGAGLPAAATLSPLASRAAPAGLWAAWTRPPPPHGRSSSGARGPAANVSVAAVPSDGCCRGRLRGRGGGRAPVGAAGGANPRTPLRWDRPSEPRAPPPPPVGPAPRRRAPPPPAPTNGGAGRGQGRGTNARGRGCGSRLVSRVPATPRCEPLLGAGLVG